MTNEPVRVATLVGAVMAAVAMLISFGVINWTDAQLSAFEEALIQVLPFVIWVVQYFANEFARARVTPLADPKDNTGTKLQRVDGLPPVAN